MLPLEELKSKYIPVEKFPELYNVSVAKVMKLVNAKKIRVAEFRAEGDHRRSLHANYEEVLSALEEEKK